MKTTNKRTSQPDDELPTVVAGQLRFFSVSSLKTFRLCPRQWWFDKVRGLPSKQTKGAQLGHECHERVEIYMLTGEDVRGPVERSGAHLLEPYREQRVRAPDTVQVEASLAPRLVTPAGVVMRGFTDLLVEPGASPWDDGLPEFVDHKFMRNFNYTPTEAELHDDLQGLGYAAWGLFVRWSGRDRVRFTHHQHVREGRDREPRRVSVVHDLTHVRSAWEEIVRDVDLHMRGVARQTDETRVPVGDIENENGKGACCDAYGRCSYRSVCSASPENRFFNLVMPPAQSPKENTMPSLLNQVMQSKSPSAPAAPANPQPVAGTTPPPQTASPANYGQCPSGCGAWVTAENGAKLPSGRVVHVDCPGTKAAPPAAASGKIKAKDAAQGVTYYLGGDKAGKLVQNAGAFSVFELTNGDPLTIKGDTEIEALVEKPVEVTMFEKPAQGSRNVGGAVLPPDAPASNPGAADAAGKPAQTAEQLQKAADEAAERADASGGDGGDVHDAVELQKAADEAKTAEKQKRGRSKKDADATGGTPGVVTSTITNAITVIVNASVSHPIAQPLGPVIQQVAQQIAEAGKVLDVRSAPKDHPLAYGAWKGVLGAGVEKLLGPGLYTVDSGDLADPVIERLSGKAVIIRGR